jgi:hypothetical protein
MDTSANGITPKGVWTDHASQRLHARGGARDSTAGEPAGPRSATRPSGDRSGDRGDEPRQRARSGGAHWTPRSIAKLHLMSGSLRKMEPSHAAAPAKPSRWLHARGGARGSNSNRAHRHRRDTPTRRLRGWKSVSGRVCGRDDAGVMHRGSSREYGRRNDGAFRHGAAARLQNPATQKAACPR